MCITLYSIPLHHTIVGCVTVLTFLIFQILLFDRSIGIVVQLNIMEAYGIMVFRTEKDGGGSTSGSHHNYNAASSSGSGGKIYVFRLSELEEHLLELMEWNHNVDSLLHNENSGDLQVKLCSHPIHVEWVKH